MTAAHPGDLDAQIDLFGATRQRSHQTEAGAPIGGYLKSILNKPRWDGGFAWETCR